MNFNLEQTEFPTAVHQQIYFAARGLTPQEVSLAGIGDPALRASCRSYHAFLLDMLSDMYDNPEAWKLPAGELEEFLGGKKLNGVKRQFPARTKSLLAHLRNAVHGYTRLLFLLGQSGILRDDHILVSSEDMRSMGKSVNTSVSPIPLENRLAALARIGLIENEGVFHSTRHPDMFPALISLTRSTGGKYSGFGGFAFDNAEFRNIEKKYKPTPEDYFQPLVRSRYETARTLHELARKNGCRSVISTFWKVDYKYKGVQVMCMDCTEGDLDIRITETYHWDDPELINGRLAQEPPEMQNYALRHLWRCTGCATDHLGQFVTVLGKRQRVCGGGVIGFRWRNPSEEDLKPLERFLQVRCEIIEQLKK